MVAPAALPFPTQKTSCVPVLIPGARELFIGKQYLPPDEFARIIAMETQDAELRPGLHVVRSADILVVGTSSGYVIRIDMEKLPALREGQ